jgi:hypothetical protein
MRQGRKVICKSLRNEIENPLRRSKEEDSAATTVLQGLQQHLEVIGSGNPRTDLHTYQSRNERYPYPICYDEVGLPQGGVETGIALCDH